MRCAAMRCDAVRGAAVIAMGRGRATAARGMHRTDEERDWRVGEAGPDSERRPN
jgi:hypothetical protein